MAAWQLSYVVDTGPGSTRSYGSDTRFSNTWSPCKGKALIGLQRIEDREVRGLDRSKRLGQERSKR